MTQQSTSTGFLVGAEIFIVGIVFFFLSYRYARSSMMRNMELRKSSSRKAPRRYEDELVEAYDQPSSVRVARQPAYRGKVIEYNPQLPPAAFPTLNAGALPTESRQRSDVNGPPKQRKEAQTRSSLFSHRDSPTLSQSLQEDELFQISSQTIPETLQQPQMAFRASTSLRPGDNGPGNPIWESNMAMMASSGQLTEDELFMAEMETSDEDGPPPQKSQKVCHGMVDLGSSLAPNSVLTT